eukprot:1196237-Prorocentrum_minimum.AAC.2
MERKGTVVRIYLCLLHLIGPPCEYTCASYVRLVHRVAPMDLVQQRYHTRHSTRPGREAVHDEVEIALATGKIQCRGGVEGV